MKYGQYIYEYLGDIYNDFDTLNLTTLADLQNELEKRVRQYLEDNYEAEIAGSLIAEFVKGTRNQECFKVIVNDFKRMNFSVTKPNDPKFNLFYYKDHPDGIKGKIPHGENPNLRIEKFNEIKFPNNLKVYWIENGKTSKSDLISSYYPKNDLQ